MTIGPIAFESHGALTLGVEIEVQLVDWRTKDLCPAAPRILEALGGEDARIKPEIFQAMLEICTGVCRTVAEVEADLAGSRARVIEVAGSLGVEILGAGTHPFARPEDRLVYPSDRYRMLIDRNQWIARRLAIFGLHIHVGMPDGDRAMAVSNGLLPSMAALLALSASSPFMYGQDTGLASSRTTLFESQPTAGTPPTFGSWQAFIDLCARLERSRAITSLKDLWWDLRPSPAYGTIELRICDGSARPADTLALVALVQCLAADLLARAEAGETFEQPSAWRLRENKWRAARWGLDADLVVDEDGSVRPVRDEIRAMLARLAPQARALGVAPYLARVEEILTEGTSSDRQRSVHARSRSLGSVVETLAREWRDEVDVRSQ